MDDFPSNSHRDKETKVSPKTGAVPPKKVARITTSEPKRRKKPLGTRFKETFFGGDNVRGVFGYVFGEVVVPMAKDMVADATTQAVERAVFGETRRGPRGWNRGPSSAVGHVRYDGMARQPARTAPWQGQSQREVSRRARSTHDFDEIILESRGEAEQVLDTLYEIISQYNQAAVADLYEMVGITAMYTDQKYGWTNLQGASVQHIRGGQFLLNLPKPEPLD